MYRSTTALLVALVGSSLGCRDGGGAAGPCEELLDCCTDLGEPAAGECQDAYDTYHDADDADARCQTALDSIRDIGMCQAEGGDGDGDGDGDSDVRFTVDEYDDQERIAVVTFENGSSIPLPVFQQYFSLELADGTVRQGDGTYYEGECRDTIAPGRSFTCPVRFFDPELRTTPGVRVYYVFEGHRASAPVPDDATCVLGPENTLEACTDGCNNDADQVEWVDCDDRDCCDVLATGGMSCPATSFCGG